MIELLNFHSKSSLKFYSVSEIDVKEEISNFSSKKAIGKGNVSVKDVLPKNFRKIIAIQTN